MKKSLCVVDDEHFFHRGQLTIPIKGYKSDLIFNVWTSISKENFFKRNDLWNNPARVNEEPYFGWLQTSIPTYGNTINLKTVAIENDAGQIPSIKMIEEGHPLTEDQEKGITLDKAMEIVGNILESAHDSNA